MRLTRCVAKIYFKHRLSEITFWLPCKQCFMIYTVSEVLTDPDLHCLSSTLCIIWKLHVVDVRTTCIHLLKLASDCNFNLLWENYQHLAS